MDKFLHAPDRIFATTTPVKVIISTFLFYCSRACLAISKCQTRNFIALNFLHLLSVTILLILRFHAHNLKYLSLLSSRQRNWLGDKKSSVCHFFGCPVRGKTSVARSTSLHIYDALYKLCMCFPL